MTATKSPYRAIRATLAVSACVLLLACGATYRLERAGPVAGLDCERCFTTDRFGRRITFYLYIPKAAQATPLPLAVCIHGSACCSVFTRRPEDGTIRATGGHPAARRLGGSLWPHRRLVPEPLLVTGPASPGPVRFRRGADEANSMWASMPDRSSILPRSTRRRPPARSRWDRRRRTVGSGELERIRHDLAARSRLRRPAEPADMVLEVHDWSGRASRRTAAPAFYRQQESTDAPDRP